MQINLFGFKLICTDHIAFFNVNIWKPSFCNLELLNALFFGEKYLHMSSSLHKHVIFHENKRKRKKYLIFEIISGSPLPGKFHENG